MGTTALVPACAFTDTDTDILIARAVDACARVYRAAHDARQSAEQRLRAVRDAGGLLAQVQRSTGGRRATNSSWTLTSYQSALTRAHISRQTANTWQAVAAIADGVFEDFITTGRQGLHDLTLAELLRVGRGRSRADERVRVVKLTMTEAAFADFDRQVGALRGVHRTDTFSETVLAIVSAAFARWRENQTGRAPTHTTRSIT